MVLTRQGIRLEFKPVGCRVPERKEGRIGGGVTGAEFAYFFNRVGSQVTWITDQAVLLPQIDLDLSAVLEQTLGDRGVVIIKGTAVQAAQVQGDEVRLELADGRQVRGSQALIAIGRRPDLAGLDLEAAGIAYTAHGITVDPFGRTSAPHLFAAGDVAGAPFIANRGQAQARVAVRCALDSPTPPFRPETIIEAVYTSPQLAQVGLTEAQARAQGRAIQIYRADFSAALKSRLAASPAGFIKLLVIPETGRVVGGAAVGERAADVLSTLAVAIAAAMTVEQVASLFPAYPTLAELIGIAARGY
jgi:dihydrolipoamide dehydrogenase